MARKQTKQHNKRENNGDRQQKSFSHNGNKFQENKILSGTRGVYVTPNQRSTFIERHGDTLVAAASLSQLITCLGRQIHICSIQSGQEYKDMAPWAKEALLEFDQMKESLLRLLLQIRPDGPKSTVAKIFGCYPKSDLVKDEDGEPLRDERGDKVFRVVKDKDGNLIETCRTWFAKRNIKPEVAEKCTLTLREAKIDHLLLEILSILNSKLNILEHTHDTVDAYDAEIGDEVVKYYNYFDSLLADYKQQLRTLKYRYNNPEQEDEEEDYDNQEQDDATATSSPVQEKVTVEISATKAKPVQKGISFAKAASKNIPQSAPKSPASDANSTSDEFPSLDSSTNTSQQKRTKKSRKSDSGSDSDDEYVPVEVVVLIANKKVTKRVLMSKQEAAEYAAQGDQ